ncbi:hypothetical protein [Streptomyces sp. NPDC060035]|uniref:hypothetical protein n=1 Tax=Streptomyces sp. NPDC060035 TaxID=3347044 RepID=UPI0036A2DAF8
MGASRPTNCSRDIGTAGPGVTERHPVGATTASAPLVHAHSTRDRTAATLLVRPDGYSARAGGAPAPER